MSKILSKIVDTAKGAASKAFNWARSKLINQASVLARRANQRLREIEKQGLQNTSNAYKFIEGKLYDKEHGNNVPWLARTAKQQMKFNTNLRSMSDEDIAKELHYLKGFLKAKTSYTKGVRERIAKQTQAFNEKTGLDYTQEQFTDVMTEDLVQELYKSFDPSAVARLFAENEGFAIHAQEILAALVAKEKKSLSQMTFTKIEKAFHNWESTETEKTEKEKEEIANQFDNM